MSDYADTLNRRQNMKKEELDADILREAFGPHYSLLSSMFGLPAQTPPDNAADAEVVK